MITEATWRRLNMKPQRSHDDGPTAKYIRRNEVCSTVTPEDIHAVGGLEHSLMPPEKIELAQ